MRAMVSMLIDFGQAAWHSPCQLQFPNPSASIRATIAADSSCLSRSCIVGRWQIGIPDIPQSTAESAEHGAERRP